MSAASPGDTAPEPVSEAARARGPVAPGGYRVVVIESDDRLSVADFTDRDRAEQYADDAASESDAPAPLAYVFDEQLRLVARGRHDAAR